MYTILASLAVLHLWGPQNIADLAVFPADRGDTRWRSTWLYIWKEMKYVKKADELWNYNASAMKLFVRHREGNNLPSHGEADEEWCPARRMPPATDSRSPPPIGTFRSPELKSHCEPMSKHLDFTALLSVLFQCVNKVAYLDNGCIFRHTGHHISIKQIDDHRGDGIRGHEKLSVASKHNTTLWKE